MGRLFSDNQFDELLKKKYALKEREVAAMEAKAAGPELSGNDITQMRNDAIDADLRKRALQETVNKGVLDAQESRNRGELAVSQENNAGELARKRIESELGLEGTKYSADQSLSSVKYAADQALAGNINTAEKGYQTERVKALSAILGNTDASPEDKKNSISELLTIGRRARTSLNDQTRGAQSFDDGTPVLKTALEPSSSITAPKSVNPARAELNNALTQQPKLTANPADTNSLFPRKKRFEEMNDDELRTADAEWKTRWSSSTGRIPFFAPDAPSKIASWNRGIIEEGNKRAKLFSGK